MYVTFKSSLKEAGITKPKKAILDLLAVYFPAGLMVNQHSPERARELYDSAKDWPQSDTRACLLRECSVRIGPNLNTSKPGSSLVFVPITSSLQESVLGRLIDKADKLF